MEFDTALYLRRSCREFKPDPISESDLAKIIDAADQAPLPAHYNEKTKITVVLDPGKLSAVREQLRMVRGENSFDPTYGAPVVVFLSAGPISKDNIEYANVACAIENMLLKATDLGLGSVYLWGLLHKMRREPELLGLLKIPESQKVISAAAFGYPKKTLERRVSGQGVVVEYI